MTARTLFALVVTLSLALLPRPFAAVAGDSESVAAASATGTLRYSILVNEFRDESRRHGYWNHSESLEGACEAMMTSALHQSRHFLVLAEKQTMSGNMTEIEFSNSEWVTQGDKTPRKGHMTPAQLMVEGVITHIQHDTGGTGVRGVRVPGIGIRVGGKKKSAEMNLTIYLFNVETRQVVASTNVIGKSSDKGLSIGNLPVVGGQFETYAKDNVGKATIDAIDKAVDWLVTQLEGIQWSGKVIMAAQQRVIVNRGEREGVRVGQEFVVGDVETLRDPDTGEVLYEELTQVGRLRVVEVKDRVAICQPTSGVGGIQRGMKIHLPHG